MINPIRCSIFILSFLKINTWNLVTMFIFKVVNKVTLITYPNFCKTTVLFFFYMLCMSNFSVFSTYMLLRRHNRSGKNGLTVAFTAQKTTFYAVFGKFGQLWMNLYTAIIKVLFFVCNLKRGGGVKGLELFNTYYG